MQGSATITSTDINEQQQAKEQVKLLEKFKQLRQWQQKHQQNLISQHQQQLELVRAEQERVNAILAVEKKLRFVGNGDVGIPQAEMQAMTIAQTSKNPFMKTIKNNISMEQVMSNISEDEGIALMSDQYMPMTSTTGMQSSQAMRTVKRKLLNSPQGGPGYQQQELMYISNAQLANGQMPYYINPHNAQLIQGYPMTSVPSSMPNGIPLQDVTNQMPYMNDVMLGKTVSGKPGISSPVYSDSPDGYSSNPGFFGATLPAGILQPLINGSTRPQEEDIYEQEQDDDDDDDEEEEDSDHGSSPVTISPEAESDTISGIYPLKLDDDGKSEFDDSRVREDFNDSSELDDQEEEQEDGKEESFDETAESFDQSQADVQDFEEEEEEEEEEDGESDLERTVVDDQGTNESVNHEDKPIHAGIGTGLKTFEELLEQKLKQEEARSAETKNAAPVVRKQPFLKRGEGLARFGMKSSDKLKTTKTTTSQQSKSALTTTNKQKININKQQQVVKSQTNSKQGNVKNTTNKGVNKQIPMNKQDSNKQQTIRVPVGQQDKQQTTRIAMGQTMKGLSDKGKKQSNLVNESTERNLEQKPKLMNRKIAGQFSQVDGVNSGVTDFASRVMQGPFPSITSAMEIAKQQLAGSSEMNKVSESLTMTMLEESFQQKLQEWENKAQEEEDELEEFLLLEQAAANSSLSSNSSVLMKVFSKARTDGGIKTSQMPRGLQTGVVSPVDTGYSSEDIKTITTNSGSTSPQQTPRDECDNDDGDDDDLNEQTELSCDGSSDSESDSESDSAETTIRSNMDEHEALSPPRSTSSLAAQVNFDDDETWGEINQEDIDSDDEIDMMTGVHPLITSTPPAPRAFKGVTHSGDDARVTPPPTSALVTKLFPQLKQQNKTKEQPEAVQSVPSAAGDQNKSSDIPGLQSVAVREKLQELELEIEKFRAENAALAKLKAEREEGLKRLKQEIESFEKQKSEELERLEKFREEETKKLRREKRVFEKYQKASRTVPDKKERDEIELLKSQLNELQDEMKKRESRWAAASSRSKDRIEHLETENAELQDEIKLFEQERIERLQKLEKKEHEEVKPKKILQRKVKQCEPETTSFKQPALSFEKLPPSQTPSINTQSPDVQLEIKQNNQQTTETSQPIVKRKQNTNPSRQQSITESNTSLREEESTPHVPPISLNEISSHIAKEIDSYPVPRKVHFGDGSNQCGQPIPQEIRHPDGKVETVNKDGTRVILYSNGTKKELSADGQSIIVTFFNGDFKQIMSDQRVVYYYADAQTTHTTYPDGLEVLQFPNKQIEKHYPDGTKEIIFPDQTIKYLHPNGSEECIFSDGTVQRLNKDREMTIEFPNGQREIHTQHYKKREYPDGTVKTVYPDGRQETHYSNGRVRIKDKEGRIVVDTGDNKR